MDDMVAQLQFPAIRESRNTSNSLPSPGWYIETGFGSFYVMRVGEDGSGTIYHTVQSGLEAWAAAALTEAQATIARLEAALLPFAEAAEECDEYGWDDQNQAPVDAGQCRAARAALSPGKGG